MVSRDELDKAVAEAGLDVATGSAATLAGIALGRIGVDDLARNVRIARTFAPDPAHRAVYEDRYAEFRVLHKQTSRRTKRHGRSAT